jgi:hypothetical protein
LEQITISLLRSAARLGEGGKGKRKGKGVKKGKGISSTFFTDDSPLLCHTEGIATCFFPIETA